MNKQNLFWPLIAVPSIVLVVVALLLIGPEIQGRSLTKASHIVVLRNFMRQEHEFVMPLSARLQKRQMKKCESTMASSLAQSLDTQTLGRFASSCLQLADHILHQNPTLSSAHLIRARGLFEAGDMTQAGDSYVAAHLTGKNEGWLAARRLRFFFVMELPAGAKVQQAARQDALTVLQDLRFHPLLPQLYVKYPEARVWIEAAIEGGGAKDLSRFVRLTKQKMSQTIGATE